jgi:hypothetical protein
MLKELTSALYQRNRILAVTGWLHVFAFIATGILLLLDDRQVLGINTWVKPMKFMFSLAIYLWTIAWFSEYINRPRWRIRLVSVVIAVVIIIETACILIQAGRGTTSHFNNATDFDALVFATMGMMIAIDMLMSFMIFLMFSKPHVQLERIYLWGIRLGLLMFLSGGLIGVVMITNGAHTFGGSDGGPGLPVFNWSTTAGDMRLAHGLGLHALQIVPLVAWLISRTPRITKTAGRYAAFTAFVAVYGLLTYGAYAQALAGKPVI